MSNHLSLLLKEKFLDYENLSNTEIFLWMSTSFIYFSLRVNYHDFLCHLRIFIVRKIMINLALPHFLPVWRQLPKILQKCCLTKWHHVLFGRYHKLTLQQQLCNLSSNHCEANIESLSFGLPVGPALKANVLTHLENSTFW